MTARQGRFEGRLDAAVARFGASIDFDRRLYEEDIRGSQAHARMLAAQGILPAADAEAIVAGLDTVRQEIASGALVLDPDLEDIHMNVEARLTVLIGEAGARLHTARSRNDQVATDIKLWARARARELGGSVDALRRALVEKAGEHVDTLLPGYTHLQRAQPVRLAHHLLAYCEMLGRDRGRLADAYRRMSECPLGSGALAATTFPIDREASARALGFESATHNSLDAVSDRDFAAELVFACALIGSHLSRLCEELVLWSSQEFGFVRLPEGYCSGSSIMPQKINPDVPELVRAKVGRVTGDLVTLLMVLKSLPLAYNKDLQETQEPLYDAVETTAACLQMMTGLIAGSAFDLGAMRSAVDRGHLLATEVADYLAARGVPFRRAHDVAGRLVRLASERGVELGALALAEYQALAPEFGADLFEVLDPARATDRRDVVGGPARGRILAEIQRITKEISSAPF